MLALRISASAALALLASTAILASSIAFRAPLRERFGNQLAAVRPWVALACIPVGFWLMEFPYNTALSQMESQWVGAGTLALAVLYAIVYFLGQRTKGAMAAFLVACLACGVANHYVAQFKGQPILPSDVLAAQTAASVSGGYEYAIDNTLAFALAALFAMLAAIAAIPPAKHTRTIAIANTSFGAIALAACCVWFSTVNIEDDIGVRVDVWSSLDSYQQQGSLLCFAQRAQKLSPTEPAGYSNQRAAELRTRKASEETLDELLDAPRVIRAAEATDPEIQPTIVAIMNETYSDLTLYPHVASAYEGPFSFSSYAGTIATGNAYVSAMGGGTCNSEFEFLTGSSMGLLGAGVYPYMLYNLESADNIASYLRSIGYATSAIHPADAQNWRRDRVYEQLGFDEFYDISSFQQADQFRDMVADSATYDKVLQLIDESEGPQFIFDVTIANHGGYETGTIPEEDMLHVDLGEESSAEVDEYVSAIARADADLAVFLDELSKREQPIVVVLFGDHQPGFVETLASFKTDESDEGPSIDETQLHYTTPYMLWTNSDQLARHVVRGGDTSLNYLAATTIKAAGLPLDEYFAFLFATRQTLPAVNLNGYMDGSHTWHWNGDDDSNTVEALSDLAIVQHENLFGK